MWPNWVQFGMIWGVPGGLVGGRGWIWRYLGSVVEL